MNVAFDPWIPVATARGDRALVSLADVMSRGAEYADLGVRAHERVALMRLFTSVAHAALDGPKDAEEWEEVPARLAQDSLKYLEKWRDSFEFFHTKKPWLQVAGLTAKIGKDEGTPVSKLSFFLATGNNSTLFDREGLSGNTRSRRIEDSILSLLTFQCFSPGGLISQVSWNSVESGKSSKDAPCVAASMVHAFVRGDNLFQTIHLNLPDYEEILRHYGERSIGKPVWENSPESLGDSEAIANATQTYLGRLVPLTRFVHFREQGKSLLLGDGLVYPSFADGFPAEPSAAVVTRVKDKKEERALLSFRPNKAIWRELAGIVVRRKANETGGPLSLRSSDHSTGFDLTVSALARDKATIVDTVECTYHISESFRSENGRSVYQGEVAEAEATARKLGWAIQTYRQFIDGGWEGRVKSAGPKKGELLGKLTARGHTQYWTAVEKNLGLLMAHVNAIDTCEAASTQRAWRKMLFRTACESYESACGQSTPREMKAYAEGLKRIFGKVKEEEEAQESEEEQT